MREISIPDQLHERIEQRLDDDFESVEAYVVFALGEILNQLEGGEKASAGNRNEVMDKLRDLGYLE